MIYPQPLPAGIHDIHRDGREVQGLSLALVEDDLVVFAGVSLVDEAREIREGGAIRHVVAVDHYEWRIQRALAVDVGGAVSALPHHVLV